MIKYGKWSEDAPEQPYDEQKEIYYYWKSYEEEYLRWYFETRKERLEI